LLVVDEDIELVVFKLNLISLYKQFGPLCTRIHLP
jgi:hypothetical protein